MDKSKLISFLQSKTIMSLATTSEDKPWVSNIFYVVDENFNFYFYSYPESRHILSIRENPNASVAIYDHSCNHDKLEGVQMSGTVEVVASEEAFQRAFETYLGKFKKGVSEHPAFQEGINHKSEAFYMFKPEQINYRNSEKFEGVQKLSLE